MDVYQIKQYFVLFVLLVSQKVVTDGFYICRYEIGHNLGGSWGTRIF